ncbi:glutathione S-transferase-like protein [Hysterangium stoloniferum]|nr:glutathione S-transferase-like protein [Hysterangium stoloniferum]
MVLTLYGFSLSTCTRRVAVVCKELGIPYEFVAVNLAVGEHKTPAYLEKQPFGQVPAIDDDGFKLYESRAIARYLAAKAGSPLFPISDPKKLAEFEVAASIEYSNFDPYASKIALEKVFKPLRGLATDEAVVAERLAGLTAKLEAYEVILGKQKYLAGDEVTLADLFHLPYGSVLVQAGVDIFSTPNVKRWWNDISSRPSWQAVKHSA